MGIEYSAEESAAIYELGRMYFEMGYLAAAERIFNGLTVVDGGRTPSRVGLGVVKLERGAFDQAFEQFRAAMKSGRFELEAKLGLCASLVAMGDFTHASEFLDELRPQVEATPEEAVKRIYRALALRTRANPDF